MLNFRAALCQNSTFHTCQTEGWGGGVIASVPMRPTCSVSIIMFFCLLCAHLQGWGGVLTSVRMRLASSVSVVAPCRGGFADTNTVVFVVLTKNPASSRFKAVFLKQAALTVLRIMMMVLMIMMLMLLITMMLAGMMILMIMMLMLLLAHAQENDGDDDNSDDNKDNGNVAPCCSCFHVTSETLPIQESRVL